MATLTDLQAYDLGQSAAAADMNAPLFEDDGLRLSAVQGWADAAGTERDHPRDPTHPNIVLCHYGYAKFDALARDRDRDAPRQGAYVAAYAN